MNIMRRGVYILMGLLILLLAAMVMLPTHEATAQDDCVFAETWMGAVNGQLPENVKPFDYRVTDGEWNFPEWVDSSPLRGSLALNGGYLVYGLRRPEGEIITDPKVYQEYEQRSRITFHMIFCDLSKSDVDNKEHNIRVYEVRQ